MEASWLSRGCLLGVVFLLRVDLLFTAPVMLEPRLASAGVLVPSLSGIWEFESTFSKIESSVLSWLLSAAFDSIFDSSLLVWGGDRFIFELRSGEASEFDGFEIWRPIVIDLPAPFLPGVVAPWPVPPPFAIFA